MSAAKHFAEQLEKHEEVHQGAGWGDHFDFCTWYGTAAIILSFSAIEAALDEVQDDLQISSYLTKTFERARALDVAQAILAFRNCIPFDRGSEPFQSADLLRALRNGLVHPKAEWDHDRVVHEKLTRRIVGQNLNLSPFVEDAKLAFPHGCMSAGVANWSARTAECFIRELRKRLDLSKPV